VVRELEALPDGYVDRKFAIHKSAPPKGKRYVQVDITEIEYAETEATERELAVGPRNEFDCFDDLDEAYPPITEQEAYFNPSWLPDTNRDIKMIAAYLHDQGKGHVLPDMIEQVTGVRPPDEDFSPSKMRISDPEWWEERDRIKRDKYKAKRRANMTDEEKAKQVENLQLWKENNPDKIAAANKRRLEKRRNDRGQRELVAVDLEGFNTGRYFTDDRRDYAAELNEGIARGYCKTTEGQAKLDKQLKDHIVISTEEKLAQQQPFNRWTVHNTKWYRAQHDLNDDPIPSARNKQTTRYAADLYRASAVSVRRWK
jgi:hypothetical protein